MTDVTATKYSMLAALSVLVYDHVITLDGGIAQVLNLHRFFAAELVNCLMWAIGSHTLSEVALGWSIAIPYAMGSGLLLSMRQRFFKEQRMLVLSGESQAGVGLAFVKSAHATHEMSFSPGSLNAADASAFSAKAEASLAMDSYYA